MIKFIFKVATAESNYPTFQLALPPSRQPDTFMKPPAPVAETVPETIISSPLADVNNVDLFGSNDYYPTSTYSVIAIKVIILFSPT